MEQSETFFCYYCSEVFLDPNIHDSHIRTCPQRVECKYCSFSYAPSQIERHIQNCSSNYEIEGFVRKYKFLPRRM